MYILVVLYVYNLLTDEDFQQTDEKSPILVICHTSTIVALSNQISESFQGKILIFIKEHLDINETIKRITKMIIRSIWDTGCPKENN